MSNLATPQAIYGAAGLVAALLISMDASRLGAHRGRLGGGFVDMGPVGWFFSCWLLWVLTVPCYLAARPRLVRLHRAEGLPAFAGAHPAYAPSLAGPSSYARPGAPAAAPGWYPDPFGHAAQRWWSGMDWTEHTG